MKKFIKTDHFYQRAWERGIHQKQIDDLLKNVKPTKGKKIFLFGKKELKKANIKLDNKSYVVVVAKGKVLLTIIIVENLFQFLKSHRKTIMLF